jgi:thimet oligopeptidase
MDDLLAADAAAFGRAAEEDLDAARRALAACKALPADAPALDVVMAYDAIGRAGDRSGGLSRLLFQVHPAEEVRDVGAAASRQRSAFATELSLDREVYGRLAALSAEDLPDDDARRLLEHALRDYRRAGVDREDAVRERVSALRAELVELGQTFGRTISADVRSIRLDSVEELDGLPEDFVAAHPPEADGSITITTDPPDLIPFLKYARSRERRIELQRTAASRGAPDNLAVLDRLLAARHELATLLGHDSWASYITEDKMIRSAEAAADFVGQVAELAGARAEREAAQMLAALRAECGEDASLRDGDRLYLTERVRAEQFAFDTRDARPYLPYERVLGGVFDVITRLYGVEVHERQGITTWHEDVRVFDLVEGGQVQARFLLDMHSRPDKFKHAAMFHLTTGDRPSAALVCNLPRPDGDDPGLLDPSQVKTLFHEFGHLLHDLFAGHQPWHAFAGIATEWDFVEVPSQLFEEWGRHPGVLPTFARHHATGEPMPTELIAAMNAAEACGRGLDVRQQMLYASYSLECFRRDPATFDTHGLLAELKPRYVPFPVEEGTAFQASFGHLDGYSALYYTYMWSLTLAKDCFEVFGDDVLDPAPARAWREQVLSQGGRRDAADLMHDFLGRAPDLAAFSAWLDS